MIIKCLFCGEESKHPKCRKAKFCNMVCYSSWKVGKNNPFYKGGKSITKYGYIKVPTPLDHPRRKTSKNNKSRIFEHRLVMEKHLRRYLSEDELVHHRNGDKKDNRIENLVVVTKAEHNEIHLNSKQKTCGIPICNKPFVARGYCMKHYDQLRNNTLPKKYLQYFTFIKNGSR